MAFAAPREIWIHPRNPSAPRSNDTAALSFVANSEAARYVFVVVVVHDVMIAGRRYAMTRLCWRGWASSPERESAEARKRATRASPTSRSEGKGWHVGAQAWRRRNGGVSLVQCPSAVYGMSVASAARRARVESARTGPRPQRERAQESAALRAQAT